MAREKKGTIIIKDRMTAAASIESTHDLTRANNKGKTMECLIDLTSS